MNNADILSIFRQHMCNLFALHICAITDYGSEELAKTEARPHWRLTGDYSRRKRRL